MLYQEQKYTGIVTMPSVYVFVGNKKYTVENKNKREQIIKQFNVTQKQINWFGHELADTTLTQNATTICVVVTNKNISLPKLSLCVFSNNKNTWFTEITLLVNMENNYD
jgi:hypothetical protein